jgi:hypothetical protein
MSKRKPPKKAKAPTVMTVKKTSLSDLHELVFQVFQHLNRIADAQEKISLDMQLVANTCIRQANSMEKIVTINRLMLRRVARDFADKIDPAVAASIRRDLKTPTLAVHKAGDMTVTISKPANGETKC